MLQERAVSAGPGFGFVAPQRTSLSPAIHRMIGIAAARVSFAESSELLCELAGVRILHGGRDQQS